MKRIILTLCVIMGMVLSVQSQTPYKHGIGVTAGSMQALSYKVFPTNHFAMQFDLGTKFISTTGENVSSLTVCDFELNPNFMYQGHFTKKLYGFLGVGISMGYNWFQNHYEVNIPFFGQIGGTHRSDNGKFGVNTIWGLEYKFNAPVALQLDFRPGYGLLFHDNWTWSYFDWNLNLGVHFAL